MSRASRVIIAGHTGLEKNKAAEKLCAYLQRQDGALKNRVSVYDLEKYIGRTGGGDPRLLAGVRSGRQQRDNWQRAWDAISVDIEKSGDQCSIVHLHLVFAQRGHRVCPAPLSVIAAWRPDAVIVLIDDVYAAKRRIQLQGYDFSFSQLYEWRTAEIMFADQVALSASSADSAQGSLVRAGCDSVVVAVKHPVSTIGRMLLDRSSPRVYISFPISSTRSTSARRLEVNKFRTQMHKLFVTFDPLTIEELPLVYEGERRARGRREFHPVLGKNRKRKPIGQQRWDCRVGTKPDFEPLVWECEKSANHAGKTEAFYPVRFAARELDELWGKDGREDTCVVVDHVTTRDIRLVQQADFVVCYRPYWDGRITGGVGSEVKHANGTSKPVYAYVAHDLKGAKPLEGHFDKQFTDLKKFWSFLREEANRRVTLPRTLYY